ESSVAKHHFFDFFFVRRRQKLTCLLIMKYPGKKPGISLDAPSYHNAVAACFPYYGLCFFRGIYVSISNDRNRNCLFYLPDNIPVCLSGIILLPGSPMYSYGCSSCILCDFC